MSEMPPLHELEQDPERWHELSRQIRAEQRERWGRWYYVLHPLIVVYATAFMLVRWIVVTIIGLVWSILTLPFRGRR